MIETHITLWLGDPGHSSWSLRGWLLFERFGLIAKTRFVDLSDERGVAAMLADAAPLARTVPTMVTPEGAVVSESLAIAEELATRFPDAGHWPADPALRARARTLAAEMAAGFLPLRAACPMNLFVAYEPVDVDDAVRADLARLDAIWGAALEASGGPWLCGAYSAADAFYAPVATRIATYDLAVSETAQAVDRPLRRSGQRRVVQAARRQRQAAYREGVPGRQLLVVEARRHTLSARLEERFAPRRE